MDRGYENCPFFAFKLSLNIFTFVLQPIETTYILSCRKGDRVKLVESKDHQSLNESVVSLLPTFPLLSCLYHERLKNVLNVRESLSSLTPRNSIGQDVNQVPIKYLINSYSSIQLIYFNVNAQLFTFTNNNSHYPFHIQCRCMCFSF